MDFDAERTAGNNDQRHRLVISGIYDTTGFAGVRVSWALVRTGRSARSSPRIGSPYTARVGAVDLNGDGNTRNDIAPGTVRNQFHLPAIVTFDPRIAREIRWDPFAAADLGGVHLFNRDNFITVDAIYSVPARR